MGLRIGIPQTTYDNKILICDQCKGYGYISKESLADYHRGEYDTTYHICKWCGGCGRLKQNKEIITTIERYDEKVIKELVIEKLKAK